MDPVSLITEIPKQGTVAGILAILLALSVSLNFFFMKMILAEKDKQIAAAKSTTENIVGPLKAIGDGVASLVDAALRGKRR